VDKDIKFSKIESSLRSKAWVQERRGKVLIWMRAVFIKFQPRKKSYSKFVIVAIINLHKQILVELIRKNPRSVMIINQLGVKQMYRLILHRARIKVSLSVLEEGSLAGPIWKRESIKWQRQAKQIKTKLTHWINR
jgi:hypothetical protein